MMLDVIQKDGHTDSKSVETSCKVIMSHCQMILDNLTEVCNVRKHDKVNPSDLC
jgi:hypothetical protein